MSGDKEKAAAAKIKAWRANPEQCVMDLFSAGYLKLHNEPLTPDPWQSEALAALTGQPKRRFAFAASKNALKTCTLAWVAWWFLLCHRDAQIIATSISWDQLKAGLWKELAVWYSLSPLLQAQFKMTGESIVARKSNAKPEDDHGATWWIKARSWPKDAQPQQTEVLAGFHNKHLMFIGDEAGGFPEGVVEAADAIFAGKDVNAYLVLAGNTVRQAGPLYKAVLNQAGLYWVKRISGDPADPQRCTRVSVEWAKEQLAQCGGDKNHPYYKINVLGEFPDVASDKLLGPDELDKAMARNPARSLFVDEPIIVGIDTADGGADQTALCVRQGCVSYRIKTWRTGDPMVLADQIAAVLSDLSRVSEGLKGKKADAIFVDFGGPSGHGIQSRLAQLGFNASGVDFGSPPIWGDPAAPVFVNRRAEMGWKAAQWVRSHGALPQDQELRAELLEPSFWMAKTGLAKFLFEPKDAIKTRLSRSPDRADAFWLTFAAPVAHRQDEMYVATTRKQFDPYASLGGRQ